MFGYVEAGVQLSLIRQSVTISVRMPAAVRAVLIHVVADHQALRGGFSRHFEDLRKILRVRLAVVHVLVGGDELEIRRRKADPAQARLHAVLREERIRRED